MATPRRSGRVAAQDVKPDYTEPNESGRERKRKSDATGNSPSAKRGRKTKSKENLKEQKTLEETMDVYVEDRAMYRDALTRLATRRTPSPNQRNSAVKLPQMSQRRRRLTQSYQRIQTRPSKLLIK